MYRLLQFRGEAQAPGTMMQWLQRPWTSALLAAILFIDAATLPRASTVGRTLPFTHVRCCCFRFPTIELGLTDSGTWERLDSPEDQVRPTNLSLETVVSAWPWPRRRGWYAMTTETVDPKLRIAWTSRALTPLETAQVHALFADYLVAEHWCDTDPTVCELVRTQSGPIETPLVAGYVHNGVALVLLGMLMGSLRWIPVRMRLARMQRAIMQGFCPICSYDLRCSGHRCPECGWRPEQTPDVRDTTSFHQNME